MSVGRQKSAENAQSLCNRKLYHGPAKRDVSRTVIPQVGYRTQKFRKGHGEARDGQVQNQTQRKSGKIATKHDRQRHQRARYQRNCAYRCTGVNHVSFRRGETWSVWRHAHAAVSRCCFRTETNGKLRQTFVNVPRMPLNRLLTSHFP